MSKKQTVCASCHEKGVPVKHTKGSIWLEILLWVLFFPVGFVYSVWRMTTKRKVCAVCGSGELVPLESARGREILKSL